MAAAGRRTSVTNSTATATVRSRRVSHTESPQHPSSPRPALSSSVSQLTRRARCTPGGARRPTDCWPAARSLSARRRRRRGLPSLGIAGAAAAAGGGGRPVATRRSGASLTHGPGWDGTDGGGGGGLTDRSAGPLHRLRPDYAQVERPSFVPLTC